MSDAYEAAFMALIRTAMALNTLARAALRPARPQDMLRCGGNARRPCERSEATPGVRSEAGLLRRFAPRNDGWRLRFLSVAAANVAY